MVKILEMNTRNFKLFLFALLISFGSYAQLQVSKLFSDHMVLQRDQPIHVWGWQTKGKKVIVTFNNMVKSTRADRNGAWEVVFPKMEANATPQVLKVASGKEEKLFTDVIIGDVWVCSGQSNMEWQLKNTNDATVEIARSSDALLRHFKIPNSSAKVPEETLVGGEWEVANPENSGNFTAVGYYFAKKLRQDENIPIGLLNTSWGGSRIEPWMSAQTLGIKNPENFLEELLREKKEEYLKEVEKIRHSFPGIIEQKGDFKNDNDTWAKTEQNIADWQKIAVPGLWEGQGYNGFDGVAWYRTDFELHNDEITDGIEVHLGMIDDSDFTWVNGKLTGETILQYNVQRNYKVAPELLKPGTNTLAVRVDDTGGGGGIYGEPSSVYIQTSKRRIPLNKDWFFKIESYRLPGFSRINQTPTLLYNKMIYPILKFPIKGAIWYQGESNTGDEKEAYNYRDLFQKMIQQWRNDWKIGNFPFLFVQLANFMQPRELPEDSNWAILRESQTETLELPNTAQAVIIDIGEANDIHPRNKKDVGYRLALAAEKLAYGKDQIIAGPTFKGYEIDKNKVIVSFFNVENGLVCKNKYGYVNGFAIAGADKKFYWAKGMVQDNTVVIWNSNVEKPLYVRYAWADNPDDVDLYNKEGLPAVPFRFTIRDSTK